MKYILLLSMLTFFNFCICQVPPLVFAGVDQVIFYPYNSVMLKGSVIGIDAEIKSLCWEQLVGK